MRYLVANLKMKLVSEQEHAEYCVALGEALKGVKKKKDVRLVVCPSFPFLGDFKKKLPKGAMLGAQDVHWEEVGAYTGGVSPRSLADFGVSFCLVGHSERREFFAETDEMVAKKVSACLRNAIQPVICIGETEAERAEGKTLAVLRRQVQAACGGVSREEFKRVIIAYEPRWAIGSDRTPSSDEILEVIISIRRSLVESFDRHEIDALPILYGGSVSADRARDILHTSGLSGVLVGREGLLPKELMKIADMLSDNSVKESL